MAINYLFFLSLSPQSLFAYILSPYPLGHQCRVYIYVNVVLAGRPGEIRKWLMRSYIYISLHFYDSGDFRFSFSLSHHHIEGRWV
jgi:hypothetical protein